MVQRFTYQVVLYNLKSSKELVVAAEFSDIGGARRAMNMIANKNWQLNRRPDVHTIGDLIMCIRVKGRSE
jgi:hypothetical protein